MNVLDIILAIPLVLFIWKGYKKGIIYELATLFGLVAGIYAAVHFSCLVAEWIDMEGEGAVLVAFFITFIAVVILSFLLGKCVQGFVKLVKVGFLDNLIGALFGMLQCVCILSILLYYVTVIDYSEKLLTPTVKEESVLYRPVNKTGNKLIGSLKVCVAQYRESKTNTD